MHQASFAVLVLVIVLGLVFEFVNGFHDAANAVATVIATRVLPPLAAVGLAGVLNFVGAVSGTAVATTVGKGIVDPHVVTLQAVAAGLLAGILWDLATWYVGMPTSSSHALIFGVLGAGIATGGFRVVVGGIRKVAPGIIYSPLLGLVIATAIVVGLNWLVFRRPPARISSGFSRLQLLSSAYMAFSHGSNDGQKTMGIIALALLTYGVLGHTFYVPLWVITAAAVAMAAGTAAGGYRIVRTMGFKLVKLDPLHGFAAETAAGAVIEVASRLGVPISTTHAINGAILDVGTVKQRRAVRWGLARTIVIAWIQTLPGAALLGWVLVKASMTIFGA